MLTTFVLFFTVARHDEGPHQESAIRKVGSSDPFRAIRIFDLVKIVDAIRQRLLSLVHVNNCMNHWTASLFLFFSLGLSLSLLTVIFHYCIIPQESRLSPSEDIILLSLSLSCLGSSYSRVHFRTYSRMERRIQILFGSVRR